MRRLGTALAVVIAMMVLGGCSGIPQDDRYQTHDGGRSNTRAEAPANSSPIVIATTELSTA